MASDCIFCRIIAGELPSTQLYADDLVVGTEEQGAELCRLPREAVVGLTLSREDADANSTALGLLALTRAQIKSGPEGSIGEKIRKALDTPITIKVENAALS